MTSMISTLAMGDWLSVEINDRDGRYRGGNSGNDEKSIFVTLNGNGQYLDAFSPYTHTVMTLDRTDREGAFEF